MEADFTNYARITLDQTSSIVVTVNHTTGVVDVDAPDQVITAAGGTLDNTLTTFLLCYTPDSTVSDDTTVIPVARYDFAGTTNGEDLTATVAAAGLLQA